VIVNQFGTERSVRCRLDGAVCQAARQLEPQRQFDRRFDDHHHHPDHAVVAGGLHGPVARNERAEHCRFAPFAYGARRCTYGLCMRVRACACLFVCLFVCIVVRCTFGVVQCGVDSLMEWLALRARAGMKAVSLQTRDSVCAIHANSSLIYFGGVLLISSIDSRTSRRKMPRPWLRSCRSACATWVGCASTVRNRPIFCSIPP
jgi:hypothetical protein